MTNQIGYRTLPQHQTANDGGQRVHPFAVIAAAMGVAILLIPVLEFLICFKLAPGLMSTRQLAMLHTATISMVVAMCFLAYKARAEIIADSTRFRGKFLVLACFVMAPLVLLQYLIPPLLG